MVGKQVVHKPYGRRGRGRGPETDEGLVMQKAGLGTAATGSGKKKEERESARQKCGVAALYIQSRVGKG